MIEITSEYLASQGLSEGFPERFWGKVNKTDSCWIWTAGFDPHGYGAVQSGNGKRLIASRASWIITKGPIPDGLCVLHNCPGGDNPACVNPDHLWLGTRTQNMEDKIKKGRQIYGEQIGTHKLCEYQVLEARRLWLTDQFTMQELADRFGICLAAMFKVLRFQTWKKLVHGTPNSSPPGVPKISP